MRQQQYEDALVAIRRKVNTTLDHAVELADLAEAAGRGSDAEKAAAKEGLQAFGDALVEIGEIIAKLEITK